MTDKYDCQWSSKQTNAVQYVTITMIWTFILVNELILVNALRIIH